MLLVLAFLPLAYAIVTSSSRRHCVVSKPAVTRLLSSVKPFLLVQPGSHGGGSGGSVGGVDSGDGAAGADIHGQQESPVTFTRNAFVAEQLKHLARAVSSIPSSPAVGQEVGWWGDRTAGGGGDNNPHMGSAPPVFLLQSPASHLYRQLRSTPSTASNTEASGSSSRPLSHSGGAASPNERAAAAAGAAGTLDATTTPPRLDSASTSGGILQSPGGERGAGAAAPTALAAGSAAGGGGAGGPGVHAAPSPAGPPGIGGAEREASWSQGSTVQEYLVAQLQQLSQLLDSPPPRREAGPKTGSTLPELAVAVAPEEERRRSGKRSLERAGSGGSSLQYSLSTASSRSGSPFSLDGTTAAMAVTAAKKASRGSGSEGGGGEGSGESSKIDVEGVEPVSSSTTPSALFSAGRMVTTPLWPPPVPRGAAAPFEGGGLAAASLRPAGDARSPPGGGAGKVKEGERKSPTSVSPPPMVSPVPESAVGNRYGGAGLPSAAGVRPGTRVSSSAAVREGNGYKDVENGTGSGGVTADGVGDDGGRPGRERSTSAAASSAAASTGHIWSMRSVREGSEESGVLHPTRRRSSYRSRSGASHRLTEAFGRAKLWRRMLDSESRTGSAVMAGIEDENRGALEQGLVLPCAPSDEEKVIYHKTGRCFLVTAGVVSVGALSAGMWLFTFAAPFFYWFAAPTAFIMGYLLLSYFGVAVWGKDFDPEDHAARLRKAQHEHYYPSVDIFLPVCREPTHLLDNTWKYVRALDYPNVTVHVLDDGAKEERRASERENTCDRAPIVSCKVQTMHASQNTLETETADIRRTNIPELKKAGNLRYAFARTSGEVLVIFDADFCPRPEFLKETTPYFKDRDVAILQTPQFFRYREEQTWVEKGAGVTQELFYRMVQVNRDKFDASICVGTCGVYRREALAPFGGTAAIGYSEDVHTGFNCIQLGYKVRDAWTCVSGCTLTGTFARATACSGISFCHSLSFYSMYQVKYVPQVMAMGTCPDEPRAFFMQQYRWCMGSTTLLSNREFWQSTLTRKQKLCYLSGMFYYSATAMVREKWDAQRMMAIFLFEKSPLLLGKFFTDRVV
ncbi:GT2 [Ectocarpus sp. CCAP 1310/34]|nr:GT2 [Ectocarpus sp. CCAP 1310/34]